MEDLTTSSIIKLSELYLISHHYSKKGSFKDPLGLGVTTSLQGQAANDLGLSPPLEHIS